MHRRLIAVACLACMVAGAAAAGARQDVTGFWLTEKGKVVVELYRCEGALCGRLAWLAKPFDDSGALRRDRENPDPALRDRPWCGLEVITGLERAGEGRWSDGEFYYPKHGRDYRIRLERDGARLDVRAYLGLPILGKSESWTRAGPDKRGCPEEAG